MSPSTAPQPPAHGTWQSIAAGKRRMRDAQIEALLGADAVKRLARMRSRECVLDVPATCGVLSQREVAITQAQDAVTLLNRVKDGELSAVEVTEAFCKRAAVAHCLTNCLTEPLFSRAMSRAQDLDADFSRTGRTIGPLHGLPVTVKDTFRIPGVDASIGIASLCNDPSSTTSPLVQLLERAGAVVIAKTNVPQTLMALDSHNNMFGRTLNPASIRLTPGGSSGGEGACVAMRGSLVGIGTDVGGSIRIPAMCNGLVGLKPSAGRVPFADQQVGLPPGQEEIGVRASAGPICHSVRDAELIMRVLSGEDAAAVDASCVALPWRTIEPPMSKLRVGIVHSDGLTRPLPPIERFMNETVSRLQASGHVEVVTLRTEDILRKAASLVNKLFSAEGANHMFELLEATGEPLSPWLQGRLQRRPRATLERLKELHALRAEMQQEFLKAWRHDGGYWTNSNGKAEARLDVILAPVAPHPTPEVDRWNTAAYTAVWVLLDLPAATLPVRIMRKADLVGEVPSGKALSGWDEYNRKLWTDVDRNVYEGSTLALQVVGTRLQEEKVLQAMRVLEGLLRTEHTDVPPAKL